MENFKNIKESKIEKENNDIEKFKRSVELWKEYVKKVSYTRGSGTMVRTTFDEDYGQQYGCSPGGIIEVQFFQGTMTSKGVPKEEVSKEYRKKIEEESGFKISDEEFNDMKLLDVVSEYVDFLDGKGYSFKGRLSSFDQEEFDKKINIIKKIGFEKDIEIKEEYRKIKEKYDLREDYTQYKIDWDLLFYKYFEGGGDNVEIEYLQNEEIKLKNNQDNGDEKMSKKEIIERLLEETDEFNIDWEMKPQFNGYGDFKYGYGIRDNGEKIRNWDMNNRIESFYVPLEKLKNFNVGDEEYTLLSVVDVYGGGEQYDRVILVKGDVADSKLSRKDDEWIINNDKVANINNKSLKDSDWMNDDNPFASWKNKK